MKNYRPNLKIGFKLLVLILTFSFLVFDLTLAQEPPFDFGDAPDFPVNGYPSLSANDGARHKDISRFRLGSLVDAENESLQVDNDLDDGLDPIHLSVKIKNESWEDKIFLNVLLDVNQDGDWEDAPEWIVKNQIFSIPTGETLTYQLPISAFTLLPLGLNLEYTWLRLTVTDTPIENYIRKGEYYFGETEDHLIKPLPTFPPLPTPLGPSGPPPVSGGPGHGGGGGGDDGGGGGGGGGGDGGGGGTGPGRGEGGSVPGDL